MEVNTGKLLTAYFEKHRTRRAVLARLLDVNYHSILEYQRKESLQTKRLVALCSHLKHNFFMDIGMMLPSSYTTTKDLFEEKNQHIAALEEELKLVKAERDVLLKVLGR